MVDGVVLAFQAAGPFIQGGQVGIKVAGVTAAGHLSLRAADTAQGVGIVGGVRHDDQHVHPFVEGQILGSGEAHARGGNALNGGVVLQG